ncbi:hypothetical protein Ccrd_016631 [Cynara cardunculus var. scolymus]|uniref:Disease resistance protein RPS4B/Roq1-like leucine-rich repeats domain-containing protein n=1 Tax=Cynara cardunculus var. scolymus TaxID=59895 RepID=A0A103Y9K9_CYNCS|nr:hypothetical protein Ccrd_016631 [Cynara cardunculus var. scolymus]
MFATVFWQFLTNLKSLNLSNSKFLRTTPDFSGVPKLDELSLRFCSGLIELDPSIGHLGKLTELNLGHCENLKSLPKSICGLSLLERLYLDECSNLEKLPEEVGKIESLQELYATGTAITQLPDSIGLLKKLKQVSLAQSNKRDMKAKPWFSFFPFQIFSQTPTAIKFLPPTVSTLSSIKDMDLSDRDLSDTDIPYDLSQLSSLRYLHLNGNNFVSLPSSLSQLCGLQHLWLNDCKFLQSIMEFPPNLRTLDASNCPLLEGLPNLSNLKHLECIEPDYLEMTYWVDYVNEGKHDVTLQVIIKNKTNDTEWTYEANFFRTFEVNSWVSNGPQPYPIRCGDKIEVYAGGDEDLKVEKCGIHLAYKQHSQSMMETESKILVDFIPQKRGHVAVQTSNKSSNENKLSKRLKLE